ncbi:hypothetical protein WJX81_007186 [Elliptochloris bilobata]|uniref:Rhodanese domain-containing protein n=1 Tax=Elliptochloris bilobata TaxID=381761 RepID=A0AAW1QXY0_9CHLO
MLSEVVRLRAEIERYSRQIVLPAFGVEAQAKLCGAAVLVVGAGGLGSPAALYLAAAGVGRLGIVDCDAVERSNLHRQVIHSEAAVGGHKALSAAAACRAVNSSIQVEAHCCRLAPGNALELVRGYDAVVDASDNAFTRYLLSDACAVARRPLMSGAALGTDGHLTVYCLGDDGPCHRCLFPEAPRPEACGRCSDAGVLGPVPGIIGTLQAMEAVKVVTGVGRPLSRRLLMLDALQGRMHTVKLRAKMVGCVACSAAATITSASLASYDYAAFTGAQPNDAAPPQLHLLRDAERLSPAALRERLEDGEEAVVVDVRPRNQFDIAHIPGSLSCPYDVGRPDQRGNDSQRVVALLRENGIGCAMDMVGGLQAWAALADPSFPAY